MDVTAYLKRALCWLYPPRCLLCDARGEIIDSKIIDLCRDCKQQLPWNRVACARCALPLPAGTGSGAICGLCQNRAPVYEASFSLFRYQQPVVWLVQQLKFNQRLSHTRVLGELFADQAMARLSRVDAGPQCILPVPLHHKRLRSRGFNQSTELARPLARRAGLPLLLDHIERTRATEAQTGLDAKQRRKNIRGAFVCVRSIPYKHVAIFDDVVTTGSTVNELARVLKKAGVERVEVWSIARAG